MIIYKKYGYDVSSPTYIGESDKSKRVCRFCHGRYPDVTFRSKAHAISESIGNKYLINREECDSCNSKFNPIEQEFYNYHAVRLSYCNQGGKAGVRKIKEKDLAFYNKNDIWTIETMSKEDFDTKIHSIEQGNTSASIDTRLTSAHYVEQNIYKCLCKYVIGILAPELLMQFNDTINWINSKELTPISLPKLLAYVPDCVLQHPRIAYFIRQQASPNASFALGCLEFADIGYFFIIPFCKDYVEITPTVYQNFILAYHNLFDKRPYKELSLNGIIKKTYSFKMEIRNIIIGKTAFIQDFSTDNAK